MAGRHAVRRRDDLDGGDLPAQGVGYLIEQGVDRPSEGRLAFELVAQGASDGRRERQDEPSPAQGLARLQRDERCARHRMAVDRSDTYLDHRDLPEAVGSAPNADRRRQATDSLAIATYE